jgi:hypothetical protein
VKLAKADRCLWRAHFELSICSLAAELFSKCNAIREIGQSGLSFGRADQENLVGLRAAIVFLPPKVF